MNRLLSHETHPPVRSAAPGPDLDAKLAWLRDWLAGGPPPRPVEVIETHMAWVLLAGSLVLKLKKPVRYPFLDFSTLDAREHDAREEVRLNRRLAPDVYLGVRALVQTPDGLSLDGDEQGTDCQVVDWLVVMRRLPAQRMLDALIRAESLRVTDLLRLADLLARFYRSATPIRLSAADYLHRLHLEHAENARVLLDPAFGSNATTLAMSRYATALEAHAATLGARAEQGRIVDGHGDLRPEHVCLARPVAIIDCIAFNDTLRQVDPLDEIAYLALECRLAGAGWPGATLWARCRQDLDDHPPEALFDLYTARRALLRARLALAHLLEPSPRTRERWQPRAGLYVAEAGAALQALGPS